MWDRPNKNECRSLMLDLLKNDGFRISSGLWLPGQDAKCVIQASQMDILAEESQHVFVDRDEFAFELMTDELSTSGIGGECLCCELHAVTADREYDWANFDFNGQLTHECAAWMLQYFAPKLVSHHYMAFTFLVAQRNNRFMKLCWEFFQNYPDHVRDITRSFRVTDPNVVTYMLTILNLYDAHRYAVYHIPYMDTLPMHVLILKSGEPSSRYSLPVSSEFKDFVLNAEPVPRQGLSITRRVDMAKSDKTAAQKAWDTRRRQAEKRSEAARKAWRTRRALAK